MSAEIKMTAPIRGKVLSPVDQFHQGPGEKIGSHTESHQMDFAVGGIIQDLLDEGGQMADRLGAVDHGLVDFIIAERNASMGRPAIEEGHAGKLQVIGDLRGFLGAFLEGGGKTMDINKGLVLVVRTQGCREGGGIDGMSLPQAGLVVPIDPSNATSRKPGRYGGGNGDGGPFGLPRNPGWGPCPKYTGLF